MHNRILIGITGATGMLYVPSLLQYLEQLQVEVHAVISDAGAQVLQLELGITPQELSGIAQWFRFDNFAALPASGSVLYDGMVILPCTMGTLAAISTGVCGNLIHRAADVSLKEKRKLILAVRETPLNRNHLENMLKAHDAGATICPLMPTFYNKPTSFQEMADNYTGRICDLLGYQGHVYTRWHGE